MADDDEQELGEMADEDDDRDAESEVEEAVEVLVDSDDVGFWRPISRLVAVLLATCEIGLVGLAMLSTESLPCS